MSQFRSRFQSPPPRPQTREVDVRLRTQGESYASEQNQSPYGRRQVETQKLKSLSFWSNTDQEGGEEDEWIERQSPTPFILGIIILVVASTLLWFLFRWASGENTSTPPIIAADTAPFKVRPENPGGMMIPHQDKLVYGRLTQGAPQPIERLLPPPEQPMVAAPPMAVQPMGAPQMNSPQQQQGYAQPQQGYAPNTVMQQGVQPQPSSQHPQSYPPFQSQSPYPQQQPEPGPSLQGQQYQSQPIQGQPMQPMQGQPSYPISSQSQAQYGPPAPQPAVMPQSPQVPQHAPNLDGQNHVSEVEGIKPAVDEDVVEDKSDRSGQSELDRLITREANTPVKRSTKKKDEKSSI